MTGSEAGEREEKTVREIISQAARLQRTPYLNGDETCHLEGFSGNRAKLNFSNEAAVDVAMKLVCTSGEVAVTQRLILERIKNAAIQNLKNNERSCLIECTDRSCVERYIGDMDSIQSKVKYYKGSNLFTGLAGICGVVENWPAPIRWSSMNVSA